MTHSPTPPPPPAGIPPLGATPGESEKLLQEMRVEQRSYLEEVEDAVAETEAASTPLDMRLMQLGNRSIDVTVDLADRQIRGRIAHVAGEIATVETIGGGRFNVVMGRIMSLRHSNAAGETRAVDTGHPHTAIARLRELWTMGERCTIGRTAGAAVLGDITAVTEGHVECTDPQGTSWIIPLDAVAWVGPKL